MKKILLSASLLMLSTAAFAAIDDFAYEARNGLTCENLWILDYNHSGEGNPGTELKKYEISGSSSPSAVTDGEYIYAATTTRTIDASNTAACIEVFDFMTGAYVKTIDLTLDGQPFTGTLVANNVGIDEYGNLWVGSMISNTNGDANAPIYLVDKETGALTSVGTLSVQGGKGRTDYWDVIGDLTGVNAGATVLGVTSAADNINIFNWRLEQGSTTWNGGWEDGSVTRMANGTYPADVIGWSTGSMCKMFRPSEDGVLTTFYIDACNTYPALYYNDGSMSENNFGNVDYIKTDPDDPTITSGTIPAPVTTNPNGIAEGTIGDNHFIAYVIEEHDKGCQRIAVTSVDADFNFTSMEYLWTLPEAGLGTVQAGGRRLGVIQFIEGESDAEGNACGYLFYYKGGNGMAVYRIAEEGFKGSVAENFVADANITVNGDVIAVSEVAESIEVYNVAGQMVGQVENASEIAAPATGLYIVKAVVEGAPVVKKVIVK